MLAALILTAAAATCTRVYAPEGGARFLGAEAEIDWFLVVDDRIAATSAAPALPRGLVATAGGLSRDGAPCDELDVSGATVTPGLVSVGGALGLVEVGAVGATRNADAGGDPVRATFRPADAYDPLASPIAVSRARGLTHAVVFPSGGRVAGQAALVRLAGQTQAESVLAPQVAIVASLGGESRAGALRELRHLLADAREVARRGADVDQGRTRPLAAHPRELAALLPVLRREIPLVIGADRAADIEALIRFAREEDVRLVITGGAEAWRHAAALAEAGIAVGIDPLVFGPGGFDQREARPDNAALLAAAGVPLFLSTFDTHNARNLTQVAGVAVSRGLAPEAALAAITSTPARVFGLPGHGRLAVGQEASFVVWRDPDGRAADPLELSATVASVWIAGGEVSTRSRQDALFERYLELPGTPLPSLSLP
jgi:imidazolonepropionase-like amidohydrolase